MLRAGTDRYQGVVAAKARAAQARAAGRTTTIFFFQLHRSSHRVDLGGAVRIVFALN